MMMPQTCEDENFETSIPNDQTITNLANLPAGRSTGITKCYITYTILTHANFWLLLKNLDIGLLRLWFWILPNSELIYPFFVRPYDCSYYHLQFIRISWIISGLRFRAYKSRESPTWILLNSNFATTLLILDFFTLIYL